MTRAERTRKSGFSLRLEQGQGRLVLGERRAGDVLYVEQLHLGLRQVPARLDMTEGVERFRHAWTRLDLLTVSADDQELAVLLRNAARDTGLRELDLRVVDGDAVVAGEVHDGVPFLARLRLEPASVGGERALLVSVYEIRLYGPCRLSGPEVATQLLRAAGLGEALAGPTCAVFDPVERLCAEIFAEMGWKLPDRSEVKLTEARVEAGRIRLSAARAEPSRGGLRPVTAPEGASAAMRYRRFLADYEAKTLYAALEADVAAGRLDRAAAAYERQLQLHPEHPFLVTRLLQLWQARPESRPEADALARTHLERYADDADALVALAVVQQSQGNALGAAEQYRRLATIAERQGDTMEAAQALCAVARALATREPLLAIEALERALALRRRLPGALRALADLYERAGNVPGAIQARERLLAGEAPGPGRVALLLDLGRLTLERAGDAEAAASWYERVIEESPEDVDAWLGLARALQQAGRLLPAVRALDRAAVLLQQRGDPRRAARVLVTLGDLWSSLPEGGAATAALRYRQALLLEPALPRALLGLAESAAAEGDARRARTHLEELLRLGPQSPGGARVEPGERVEAHLRLGRLLADDLHEPAQAIAHFQKALEGDPAQSAEAIEALERLFSAQGRKDDLGRLLEMAAERAPDEATRAARLFRQAQVLREMGDLRRAADLLVRAAEVPPPRTDVLRALVEVQRRRANWAGAAEALLRLTRDAAVESATELASFHADRGELLRHRLNRSDDAAEAWSLALGCDPLCMPALDGLAELYRERERYVELAPLLSRRAGLETEPAAAGALYLELARLYRGPLDRPEAAQEALERVLEKAPGEPEALRGLGDLHFDAGRAERAWALYERLLSIYEKEGFDEPAGPFLAHLARVCQALHRDEEASALLDRARDLEPERREIYEAAQDLRLRTGDLAGVVDFFTAGLTRARRPETRLFLARRAGRLLWRELRRPEAAAALLDEALSLSPDEPDVLQVRLEVATALADWPKVSALLRRQLELAPPAERPALLTRLAELAFGALGRPDEGQELARAALLEDPDYVPAVNLLAERTFEAADWRTATEAYARLVELVGEAARPEDRLRLGIARMYSGRPGEALAGLRALHAAGVALPDLLPTLTEASLQAGDADALSEILEARLAALTNPPARESFLRRAAEVFERAGRSDAAAGLWERLLADRPDDAEAAAAMNRLHPPAPVVTGPPAPPAPVVTLPPAPPAPVQPIVSAFRTVGPSPEPAGEPGSDADPRRARLLAQATALEQAARAALDPTEGATQWLALGELYRDDLHDPDAAEIAFVEAMGGGTPGGAVWCAAEEALEELYGARNDWPALLALYEARLAHGVGDPVELRVLQASVLRLAGDLDRAAAAAEQALPDERARDLLVSLHEAAGRPVAAARLLASQLDGVPPEEAALRRWRAASLVGESDAAEACRLFAAAARDLPDTALAEEWLGFARGAHEPRALLDALVHRAQLLGGRGPEAVRRSRMLHEAAGVALESINDPAGARPLLESALEAWPENVEALERLAFVLETLGDADALVRCLEAQMAAALPGPWRGQLGLKLARVHGELRGDLDLAEQAARAAAADLGDAADMQALALWLAPAPPPPALVTAPTPVTTPVPEAPAPRPTGSLTAVEPSRRHERALTEPGTSLGDRVAAWRALVEVRTRVVDLQRLVGLVETRLLAATEPVEQATLHALAGELWRGRLGNAERARAEFQRALALDAGCPRANLGLGILEMDRGGLEEAASALFQALLNRAPHGAGLLAEEELAAFHRFRRALTQLGRADRLTAEAERILEGNPASRPALDVMDGALSQRREWDRLLACYERALAAGDDGRRNARLWRRKAELLQAMGDPRGALGALAEAVRVHPDDLVARTAALRLAHQLDDREAFVHHGEALLALPAERWASTAEQEPAWLRRPEALREAVSQARVPR